MKTFFHRHFFLLLLLTTLAGCGSTIAMYDQYAYSRVTSLKVDALELMEKAGQDYEENLKEIRDVDIMFQKVLEYEKHRPKNEIVSAMWTKLYDPKSNLYGGFIDRWKQKGKLEGSFIDDQKRIIGLSFDQIAELQSKLNKRK